MDDVALDRHVQQRTFAADAFAVHNVELCHAERRSNLVLDNLDLRVVADDFAAVFELLAAAHVQTHGGVELQRTTAGGGFGVAVHHADFLAQLVDEHRDAAGFVDDARQLAQRLTHQTRLQTDEGIAHFAVDFRLRDEGGDRVDDNDVQRAGTNQRFDDFQRLFACVGLRDIQVVNIYAQILGVHRVEGVLSVHKCRDAAHLLRLCDNVQGNGRLTGGFRAENLHNTAARNAADTQRLIQRQAARGDDLHVLLRMFTELHDGTLAELLVQIRQRVLQRLEFLLLRARHRGGFFGLCGLLCCHDTASFLDTGGDAISNRRRVSFASYRTTANSSLQGEHASFS